MLRENPEPSLSELLKDPIVEMLMKSDRVNRQEFHRLLQQVTKWLNVHPTQAAS